MNLRKRQPFVLAAVPFAQIRFGARHRAEPGEMTRVARSALGAREDVRERERAKTDAQLVRLLFAASRQRKIGAPRMPMVTRPFRFAVPDEIQRQIVT